MESKTEHNEQPPNQKKIHRRKTNLRVALLQKMFLSKFTDDEVETIKEKKRRLKKFLACKKNRMMVECNIEMIEAKAKEHDWNRPRGLKRKLDPIESPPKRFKKMLNFD
jgi:hypothetical protein